MPAVGVGEQTSVPLDDAAAFNPREFRRSLRNIGLTPGQFRVAVELCEFAGPDKPEVWPSIPTIAENCEMTQKGVQVALKALTKRGLIVCIHASKGGRGQTNRWRLMVPQTPNAGSGFVDQKPRTPVRGLASETPNTEAPKPRTQSPETPNGGSGEVVRRSELEEDRARRPSPELDNPAAYGLRPRPQQAPPCKRCKKIRGEGWCSDCKSHREACQRDRAAAGAARSAAIAACTLCNEYGELLGPDGRTPVDPIVQHHNAARSA
ncbi:helix-turn-helix domain-containing protein [Mycolicibacterium neoaurum]|uniref:helix-turn-helix domain-containing protein n=1 Tax=Mycolicibacterium neoaurum TaxID=1795 RepID=UPI003AB9B18B